MYDLLCTSICIFYDIQSTLQGREFDSLGAIDNGSSRAFLWGIVSYFM